MATKNEIKLSPTQLAMLRRLAEREENVPGGYSSAGRAASAWWRTLNVLRNYGLVTKELYYPAQITDAGRAALKAADEPTVNQATGWEAMQVCTIVKQIRKELGKAWDYMVPEVREAMIDQKVLGTVVTALPFCRITAQDISKLRQDCYIEAGLCTDSEDDEATDGDPADPCHERESCSGLGAG